MNSDINVEFDIFEISHQNNYDYYFDTYNKSLHKRSKIDNQGYEFVVRQIDDLLLKAWLKIDVLGSRDLIEVKDLKKVMDYTNKYISDLKNEIYDVGIEVTDMME